jgi:hypothetical protein
MRMVDAIKVLLNETDPEYCLSPQAEITLQDIAAESDMRTPHMPPCKAVSDGNGGAEVYFDTIDRSVHLVVARDGSSFVYSRNGSYVYIRRKSTLDLSEELGLTFCGEIQEGGVVGH